MRRTVARARRPAGRAPHQRAPARAVALAERGGVGVAELAVEDDLDAALQRGRLVVVAELAAAERQGDVGAGAGRVGLASGRLVPHCQHDAMVAAVGQGGAQEHGGVARRAGVGRVAGVADDAGPRPVERLGEGCRRVGPAAGEELVPELPGGVHHPLGQPLRQRTVAVGRDDGLPAELGHVEPRLHRQHAGRQRTVGLGRVGQRHQRTERVAARVVQVGGRDHRPPRQRHDRADRAGRVAASSSPAWAPRS